MLFRPAFRNRHRDGIMAWRLKSSVVRGEIDNRIKGTITGSVWLVGRDEPVVLKLEGNGYRDVAGCLFTFENPDPLIGDEHTDLFTEQIGAIGDYTASRKVRAFDVPVDEALDMIRCGEKPQEHWANCLYLEWFSERNGRVVIESYDYETRIVDTAWSLDEQDEAEQLEKNAESMVDFMQQIGEAIERSDEPLYDPEDDKPMDEFEWERFMKESDKRADQYSELLLKYMNHPDRDQIVAREMGWTKLPDLLADLDEAVEQGEIDLPDFDVGDFEDPVPNSLTEGVDWISDEYGHPVHPLQKLAMDTVMELWHECKDAEMLTKEAGNGELHEMLFNGQCVSAKLAGALNSLAYDRIDDHAFIVACLKRSLPYFDTMIQALEKVRKQELLASERLQRFSDEMFAIRAGIVQLIVRFRNYLN